MDFIFNRLDKRVLGILLVVFAGVFWGSVSPVSRILGKLNTDMISITILRQLMVVLFFGPWLLYSHPEELLMPKKTYLPMAIYALTGPVMTNLFFVMSLVELSVSVALVIHYTFPIITALGSFFVTGEKPCRSEWISGILISIGVFVIADPTSSLEISFIGIFWGVLGALGMAIQSLFGRRVLAKGSMSSVAFMFHTNFMGFLWLILGRTLLMGAPFGDLSMFQISLGVFMGIVGGCLAYGIYFEGLRYISASMASLGATMEMVSAIVLTAFIVGEFPTLREIIGVSIVFGAIFLAAFGNRANRKIENIAQ